MRFRRERGRLEGPCATRATPCSGSTAPISTTRSRCFGRPSAISPFLRDLPPRGWDGFLAGLWNGLAGLDSAEVAIVWTDADRMLEGGLEDLLVAARLFGSLASQVGTTERGFPRETVLRSSSSARGGTSPRSRAATSADPSCTPTRPPRSALSQVLVRLHVEPHREERELRAEDQEQRDEHDRRRR